MAKKKKEENRYEYWQGYISAMDTYMKNCGERKGWKKLKKFYLGDYAEALGLKGNIPIIRVNEVYAYVRTAVSYLFARSPKFKCNPYKTKDIIPAKLAEIAINYYWRVKKIKNQIKKAIKEAKLVGYSWVKVGYTGVPGSTENEGIENEFIKNEDLFVTYCAHDSVWYDPNAQNPPYDCTWMIHTYLKPTQKLRDKYGIEEIKSTGKLTVLEDKKNLLKPSITEISRIYEIWDKEKEELWILCDGYTEKELERKPWPKAYYTIDDEPFFVFSMLSFDEMTEMGKDDNLPEPEINAFIDQILEKIKFRSMEINHIKRFNRQMFVDENKIKESEKQKYKKGEDGAMIMVDGNPAAVVQPSSYPPIQTDAYAIENKLDSDRERISGQTGLQQGVSVQTKTRTMGELEKISEGSSNRIGEEQDIVEEFTESIAQKMLCIMRNCFDEEKYYRITGDVDFMSKQLFGGQVQAQQYQQAFKKMNILDAGSVKINGNNIIGEYDCEIVAGSTLPMNPQTRFANLLNLLRFGSAIGLTPDSIASSYLGLELMYEMELKDVAQAFSADLQKKMQPKQPNPMEQLKLLDAKQKVDKNAADTSLKKSRNMSTDLRNIKQAVENKKMLNGEEDTGGQGAV